MAIKSQILNATGDVSIGPFNTGRTRSRQKEYFKSGLDNWKTRTAVTKVRLKPAMQGDAPPRRLVSPIQFAEAANADKFPQSTVEISRVLMERHVVRLA